MADNINNSLFSQDVLDSMESENLFNQVITDALSPELKNGVLESGVPIDEIIKVLPFIIRECARNIYTSTFTSWGSRSKSSW